MQFKPSENPTRDSRVNAKSASTEIDPQTTKWECFELLVLRNDGLLSFPLPSKGTLSIGRAEGCDVRIDDPLASRKHTVLHVNPLSLEVPKGQSIRASIMVSGAGGLTSGTLQLRLDPKLTLKGFAAGEFLTGDNGNLNAGPVTDGNLTLTFQRKTGASDSGTFATLDLEATAPGNAPILIQGGQYLVGTNPVSARVVNSLITVN